MRKSPEKDWAPILRVDAGRHDETRMGNRRMTWLPDLFGAL